MKKWMLLPVLFSCLFWGCREDAQDIAFRPDEGVKVTGMNASPVRTSIGDNYSILWSADDAIALFSDKAKAEWGIAADGPFFKNQDVTNIKYLLTEGADKTSGTFGIASDNRLTFTGKYVWGNPGTHYFYACYPYRDAAGANTKLQYIPVNLPNTQVQVTANNSDHIGKLDFMYASLALEAGTKGEYIEETLNFVFRHAFSLLEFHITNATSGTLTLEGLTLDGGTVAIAGDYTFDLATSVLTSGKTTDASGTQIEGGKSNVVGLTVAGGIELAAGASTKVYMLIAPADFSSTAVGITVKTSAGNQEFTGNANFQAGKRYTKSLAVTALTPVATYDVIDFEDIVLESNGVSYGTSTGTTDSYGMCDIYTHTLYDATLTAYPYTAAMGGPSAFWCGVAYSKNCDMTVAGVSNQYSVYCKDPSTSLGGRNGSEKFAISYCGETIMGPDYTSALTFPAATEKIVDHFYVNNSTYAVLSMLNGDGFAKKFADGDWFKLTVTGLNKEGGQTGAIDFYLADYRNGKSVIVQQWTKVDLTTLGAVNKLTFTLSSSDAGAYGMNTPAYFCMDDVAIQK